MDSTRSLTGTIIVTVSRALLLALALPFTAVLGDSQPKIRALTGVMEGHQVGGVTIDLMGNIYVADFGDLVWKITGRQARNICIGVLRRIR